MLLIYISMQEDHHVNIGRNLAVICIARIRDCILEN